MSSKDTSRELSATTGAVPTKIPLGQTTELDLSALSEEQRVALMNDYARGVIDIEKEARRLGVEAVALRSNLNTLANTTKDVADAGNSVTIKHEHKTSNTRTEVVMGNTQEAQAGKLGAGFIDPKTMWIVGALIAVVIVAAIAFGG